MNLIFLNRFFYPDHSATSQMLSDLAFALARKGHKVKVITSRLTYDGSAVLPAREKIEGVEIFRTYTTAFGRGKLFGRAIDYFTFLISACAILVRQARRGDIVIAKTDPPLLSVFTSPIARIKGASHINWLQDLFPEVATALGLGEGAAQRWAMLLLRWLRDCSLVRSDANVVLGVKMARRVEKRGVPERRIAVIPNWASGAEIVPVAREENALRREWGLGDAFVVGYSGNLGRAHSFETFLHAIALLEEREQVARERPAAVAAGAVAYKSCDGPAMAAPKVRWLFIGGGAHMEELKLQTRAAACRSVLFHPYQPRERLAASLSAPDVHLISLRPGLEGLIVPSKYYGIAAAGRPAIFVGDPAGEIAHMITRNNAGFVVPEGDGARLAEAVLLLARNPSLAAEQGARARRFFERRCDVSLAVAAWEQLLGQTASRRHGAAGASR